MSVSRMDSVFGSEYYIDLKFSNINITYAMVNGDKLLKENNLTEILSQEGLKNELQQKMKEKRIKGMFMYDDKQSDEARPEVFCMNQGHVFEFTMMKKIRAHYGQYYLSNIYKFSEETELKLRALQIVNPNHMLLQEFKEQGKLIPI